VGTSLKEKLFGWIIWGFLIGVAIYLILKALDMV
jgi:hypothetical protein